MSLICVTPFVIPLLWEQTPHHWAPFSVLGQLPGSPLTLHCPLGRGAEDHPLRGGVTRGGR